MSVWRLCPSHPDLVVKKMQHSNSYLSYQTSRLVFLVPWYWAKWLISQICPPYSELSLLGDQGMPPPPEYLAYLPPHTITHARMHAHTQIWHISHFCPKNNVFAIFMQFLVILINMSHPHQWTPSWKCCYYVLGMKWISSYEQFVALQCSIKKWD